MRLIHRTDSELWGMSLNPAQWYESKHKHHHCSHRDKLQPSMSFLLITKRFTISSLSDFSWVLREFTIFFQSENHNTWLLP